MTERTGQPDPLAEQAAPPRLTADLGALFGPGPAVPAAVDAAVLRDARAGYARRRRFWLAVRAAGAAAAAAAAAVVVLVVYLDRRDATPVPVANTQQNALSGDVDRSGRVDVLDALVLARRVDAGAPSAPGDDVNGDGVVDRGDVRRVAEIAVAIDRARGGSRARQ